MPRKNPLLFQPQEFKFLHQIFLSNITSRSKQFVAIKEKKGVGLDQEEIQFVKKKFEEWVLNNPNELIWMN